jgi:hypothetical protein
MNIITVDNPIVSVRNAPANEEGRLLAMLDAIRQLNAKVAKIAVMMKVMVLGFTFSLPCSILRNPRLKVFEFYYRLLPPNPQLKLGLVHY